MQWLNPAGAWAFLAMLPVIALYLLRKKAKSVSAPSLLLWRKTENKSETNRPFQKFKNQRLLWLQLLLVALLALALMRPASLGGTQGEMAFIFDLSASMQTRDAGKTRLDAAKSEAFQMLSGMRDEDAVTVIAAGNTLTQTVVRSNDHAAVRRAIESLTAQNGSADVDGAVSLAKAMRQDLPSLGIVVFSDSYQVRDERVQILSVGQKVANRSILSLRMSTNEETALAFAQVENRGEATEAELECYADGALCDLRTVALGKDARESVRFVIPSEASVVMVRFAQSDALPADDVRYALKPMETTRRALLVSEGNIFLERALALRQDLTVVKATAADAENAAGYDLYLYDCVLPEKLPDSGAVLAIAPDRELFGIAPGDRRKGDGVLRPGISALANEICENLLLTDIALREYSPLTGGQAILTMGGNPLLAVKEEGARKTAVLGFDLHDSNLPLKPDFPILIQNLLKALLPDVTAAVDGVSCGEIATLALNERTSSVKVITPSGRSVSLEGVSFEDTNEIGVYVLEEEQTDGTIRETPFALHIPAAESDTQSMTASSGEAGGIGDRGSGREWTQWVLLCFFLILLVEWEVSRRGA